MKTENQRQQQLAAANVLSPQFLCSYDNTWQLHVIGIGQFICITSELVVDEPQPQKIEQFVDARLCLSKRRQHAGNKNQNICLHQIMFPFLLTLSCIVSVLLSHLCRLNHQCCLSRAQQPINNHPSQRNATNSGRFAHRDASYSSAASSTHKRTADPTYNPTKSPHFLPRWHYAWWITHPNDHA